MGWKDAKSWTPWGRAGTQRQMHRIFFPPCYAGKLQAAAWEQRVLTRRPAKDSETTLLLAILRGDDGLGRVRGGSQSKLDNHAGVDFGGGSHAVEEYWMIHRWHG